MVVLSRARFPLISDKEGVHQKDSGPLEPSDIGSLSHGSHLRSCLMVCSQAPEDSFRTQTTNGG